MLLCDLMCNVSIIILWCGLFVCLFVFFFYSTIIFFSVILWSSIAGYVVCWGGLQCALNTRFANTSSIFVMRYVSIPIFMVWVFSYSVLKIGKFSFSISLAYFLIFFFIRNLSLCVKFCLKVFPSFLLLPSFFVLFA